jgi:hypothetical protein
MLTFQVEAGSNNKNRARIKTEEEEDWLANCGWGIPFSFTYRIYLINKATLT